MRYLKDELRIFALLLLVLAAAAGILVIPARAFAIPADLANLHRQVLEPTVFVDAGDGTGSGTFVFSQRLGSEIETFVLTNNHVVTHEDDEPGKIGEYMNLRHPFRDPGGVTTGYAYLRAEVVAADAAHDLALLAVRGARHTFPVASLIRTRILTAGQQAVLSCCPLGYDPMMTEGMISLPGMPIEATDSKKHGWTSIVMSTPIWHGNSGGGLFVENDFGDYELVGVGEGMVGIPSYPMPVQIPHMAFAVPTYVVAAFLRKSGFGFIVGDSFAPNAGAPNAARAR